MTLTEEQLTYIRRHLHRHPELSTKEVETQRYLKTHLEKLHHDGLQEVGGTGLMLLFKGKSPGKNILLRADMDALPIQELNGMEHRSLRDGISHKCGHDGHSAILLGLAHQLSDHRPEKGTVGLLFQPAEENGMGAKAVLEDTRFDFKADMAFALHNLPGYPLHQVLCRPSSFTAAAKSVIFKLHGRTSHAAEPENGINPALAISEILELSESLSQKDIHKADFRLITTVHLTMGEKAYGVSAGYGELHFTLRSWTNEVMGILEDELLSAIKEICHRRGLGLEKEELDIFHANENDAEAVRIIEQVAKGQALSYAEPPTPFTWGEDFGLFTERFSGAMFGIGAGEDTPPLHHPEYDFPDAIIRTGINMFTGILEKVL